MDSEELLVTSKDIDRLHSEFMLFGNPAASYWFLGLEEGDHPEKDEPIDQFVHKLLRKSAKFSNAGMISLRELCAPPEGYAFLPKIDCSKPMTAVGTKYQSTWGGYIKLLLSIDRANDEKTWTLHDVKLYQKYRLGALDINSDNLGSCLLELFPMARKGRKDSKWPYKELSDREGLDYLKQAKSYQQKVESSRANALLSLVREHKPKFLFSFGGDCKNAICKELQLEQKEFQICQGKRDISVSIIQYRETKVVFSNHPTARHISNLYWKNLGGILAKEIANP